MPTVPVNQVSRGQAVLMDGQICVIVSMEHIKPGKGPAYQQIKLKNLETGKVTEKRFRTADQIEAIDVDRQTYIYSYRNADLFVFMNADTYEEMEVHKDIVDELAPFLLEGNQAVLLVAQGRVLSIELPAAVELVVTECEPGVKNATATNVFKNATVETGMIVQVPPFINKGDKLKLETGTGKYLERTAIG